jgi:hypothetical protein
VTRDSADHSGPISRRRFLRLSLDAGVLASSTLALDGRDTAATTTATLRAYLDTLIPGDETPSASQVGVVEKLLARAAADAEFGRLLDAGCLRLDQLARHRGAEDFAALSEADREAIVGQAADGDAGLDLIVFFGETRAEAFQHYYAHPASWVGLDYPGPPQPAGFLDHADPPRRRGR